jgi:hypothetical protein
VLNALMRSTPSASEWRKAPKAGLSWPGAWIVDTAVEELGGAGFDGS